MQRDNIGNRLNGKGRHGLNVTSHTKGFNCNSHKLETKSKRDSTAKAIGDNIGEGFNGKSAINWRQNQREIQQQR